MQRAQRGKVEYGEISKADITSTRSVVVSSCSKGGYTVAQQIKVVEAGGNVTKLFLKGAFHVHDVDGLRRLMAAISEAVRQAESK